MPIPVTCPGCLKRFNVSDKFAGKKGPCPSCKEVIQIPEKSEEVVVHAPEEFGPKNASGQSVLKPIEREETKFSTIAIVIGITLAILFPAAALALRLVGAFDLGQEDAPAGFAAANAMRWLVLGIGAICVAPPVVASGYTFLRDSELEGYQGTAFWVRVAACSVIYGALWGLYLYVIRMLGFVGEAPSPPFLTFLVPLLVIPGAITAMALFDLDATLASVHYGYYLVVCVLLRLIAGLGPF